MDSRFKLVYFNGLRSQRESDATRLKMFSLRHPSFGNVVLPLSMRVSGCPSWSVKVGTDGHYGVGFNTFAHIQHFNAQHYAFDVIVNHNTGSNFHGGILL